MSNLRLNQVLAKDKGAKAHAKTVTDEAYNLAQKTALFNGVKRWYVPLDDEGEKLPEEGNIVQAKTEDLLKRVAAAEGESLDLLATKETANQSASADVEVDGATVLTAMPVTVLLALEKKLVDYATFVKKLSGLDPQYTWTWSNDSDAYVAEPAAKTRTKKVPRTIVKSPATDKHPAQVDIWHEDSVVGTWYTRLSSTGITEQDRREMLAKIAKLSAAVKVAREQANLTEAPDVKIGEAVFAYLGW